MLSITTKTPLFVISLLLLLALIACGNEGTNPEAEKTPEEAVAVATPHVTTEILGDLRPEAKEIKVEVIPQNNCGGSAEVENEVSKSRSIAHTIKVEGGFEVNTEG